MQTRSGCFAIDGGGVAGLVSVVGEQATASVKVALQLLQTAAEALALSPEPARERPLQFTSGNRRRR